MYLLRTQCWSNHWPICSDYKINIYRKLFWSVCWTIASSLCKVDFPQSTHALGDACSIHGMKYEHFEKASFRHHYSFRRLSRIIHYIIIHYRILRKLKCLYMPKHAVPVSKRAVHALPQFFQLASTGACVFSLSTCYANRYLDTKRGRERERHHTSQWGLPRGVARTEQTGGMHGT